MVVFSVIGPDGAITLPVKLREQLGLHEGSVITAEVVADGILLRSTQPTPTPQQRQQVLLDTDHAYADLYQEPTAQAQEQNERDVLMGTLLDGLEPVDEDWLAAWLEEPTEPTR